jgi:uncharacterized Zn-binding protein involved in type VI secretion
VAAPAIVKNNRITGICPIHQVPAPSGIAPAGPLPFSAPLTDGLVSSVLIGGQPAAVMGSSGTNKPAHVGLHASDPFAVARTQVGRITSGSTTVLIGGKPAATAASQATCCGPTPGKLVPGVPTVLIGGG